ncbi:uncharacterized protein BDFB_001422 [Asbolus verrucosus]|uniref:DUF4774 domain-containing protein n=1 Tax=Asbolus verrucosus TaxID=1661398 RepID=A0A482VYD4_ASBVE|nr:uncharacterized protein BDFB_001422 [Asbolus verrucosus]
MINWLFLMSILAVVYCKPQYNSEDSSTVEVEKQRVVEILPQSKELLKDSTQEENTKEILEKIAQVNEKQGLYKKNSRPSYQHFPFTYLRSQEENRREGTEFKFPRNPFINPILDYIEKKNADLETKTSSDDDVRKEDEIPGQYIKRKIVHQQTMLVPMSGYLPANYNPPVQPQYFYSMNMVPNDSAAAKKSDLEKQTIDNVKNIVENSQYSSPLGLNNYYQYTPPYSIPDNYRLYGPFTSDQIFHYGRQWQWPLTQYFPIVIKDPFMHMFNALTTMVEYGPNAGTSNTCSKQAQKSQASEKNTEERARKIPESSKLSYSIVSSDKGAEITVFGGDGKSDSTTVLDIEDLQITGRTENPVGLNMTYRQSKQNQEITKTTDLLKHPLIHSVQVSKKESPKSENLRQSPPIRDQILHDDELTDEIEKADDVHVTSHEGNKKLFSKDNTGSGIFIHKIKVRKGGVAIAGPGGIATAGSGGTAIVGPNGFAYTHPDSLAIAGSGTKVVAVEPTINLTELINNHNKNKNRGQGHAPPPRYIWTHPYSIHPQKSFNPSNAPNRKTKRIDEINQSHQNPLAVAAPKQEVKVGQLSKEDEVSSDKNQSLAPYRAHPLFHYLKNKNTLQTAKIISFRNDNLTNGDVTTLILKPVAKAVAGIDGRAISSPLSRAILRQGTNVDILFEPEAVAIAGPGGVAHAQSDLEISYEDLN